MITARMPQADWNRGRCQAREGGRQSADTCCDRHGDGEGVVDYQRALPRPGSRECRGSPADRVCPTAAWIRVDHLAVGEDQHREKHDDGDGDGEHEVECPGSCGREHHDDRLGAIGDRSECVEGKRGEPFDRIDLLLGSFALAKRPSDQEVPSRWQSAVLLQAVCHARLRSSAHSPKPAT